MRYFWQNEKRASHFGNTGYNNRPARLASGLFLWLVLLGLLLITAPTTQAAGQDGTPDLTFKSGSGPNGRITVVAIQSDGKIIVAGNFTLYNNLPRPGLARLNSDGTLDNSFAATNINGTITSLAIQPDGKILYAGNFGTDTSGQCYCVKRLNPDGSKDESFYSLGGLGHVLHNHISPYIATLALQSDGKIIVGGVFTAHGSPSHVGIARLHPAGGLDSTFTASVALADDPYYTGSVYSIAIKNDGKILIGGNFAKVNQTARSRFAQLNNDGTLDTSFNPTTSIHSFVDVIKPLGSGKILISGDFSLDNGATTTRLARLNPDGSLDSSFNSGADPNFSINDMQVQNDNKILIGGTSFTNNPTPYQSIARLNPDGGLDTSFAATGFAPGNLVLALGLQADGKVLLVGALTAYNGIISKYIIRLNSNGSHDSSLTPGDAGADDAINVIAVQKNGKILIGGEFRSYKGIPRNRIARLNADGTLDSSFNPGSGFDRAVTKIVIQPDGKIIVAGEFTSYIGIPRSQLVRLNADGTLDTSFNSGIANDSTKHVYDLALQNNGKIILAGMLSHYNGTPVSHLIRLNSDGSLDSSFNSGAAGPSSVLYTLAVQSDDKIIIGGAFVSYNNVPRSGIARLNAAGSLDTSFEVATACCGSGATIFRLALQKDGKVLIGGNLKTYVGIDPAKSLARVNPDGSVDSSFATNYSAQTIVLQADGKILLGGLNTIYAEPGFKVGILRLKENGTLDSSFALTPHPSAVQAVALQSDGKILVGGDFTSYGAYTRDFIARLENTPKVNGSLSLTSSANPALVGKQLTFSAQILPLADSTTGTVSFNFNYPNGTNFSTSPIAVQSGLASYMTTTLETGSYTVTATYSGDLTHNPDNSAVYTQYVVAGCDPLLVTSSTDDGQATTCGSFSYALAQALGGKISFNLPSGANSLSFTGLLTPTLKPGVAIDGGPGGIILDGQGASGDGLRLSGNNTLTNLTIRGFGGRELVLTGKANRLYRVKIES